MRLETVAMTPVTCGACGAAVTARKSSWDQTTIQWQGDALQRCRERGAGTRYVGAGGAVFTGCDALRDAIREAAVRGELPVVDDAPLPSNPDAAAEQR